MKASTSRQSLILACLDKLKILLSEGGIRVPVPMSMNIAREYNYDPFIILTSCLLSLRARDSVTYGISKKLFETASTPQAVLKMPLEKLEKIIYASGFYHKKAQTLKAVSRELIERFGAKVPKSRHELLSLPGVGNKTASIVLAEAFGVPAIAVDTHVHRLANELGFVSTRTPDQTEKALEKIIPRDRWIEAHRTLLLCGQNRLDVSKLKIQ